MAVRCWLLYNLPTLLWLAAGGLALRPCLRLHTRARRALTRQDVAGGPDPDTYDYSLNRLWVSRILTIKASLILGSGALALVSATNTDCSPRRLSSWAIIMCIVVIGAGVGLVASLLDQFESERMGEEPSRCWLFRVGDALVFWR